MIPVDFDYILARTSREAVHAFTSISRAGGTPLYYGGGTEIITLARMHQVTPDAVIDIKAIPEAHALHLTNGRLALGSALTLTQIVENPLIEREFPLLVATVREIADRTARNKITFGGNLCGSIPYREAVLALLLCDSRLWIAGPNGMREEDIGRVFRKTMQLQPGEFIVQIVTDEAARKAPFVRMKRRKMGRVGYPIVTAAAVRVNGHIRAAFSGVCSFPFRSSAIEAELNRADLAESQRIDNATQLIPFQEVMDDFEASRAFRLFILRSALSDILQKLGG